MEMSIDISRRTNLKYFLFGILYITEGIHIAVAWVITPLYLLNLDVSPEIVTLASGAIMIPWLGKFLYGYVIDYFSIKGRKLFIISGGILASLTLLCISIVNPETSLTGFIVLLFLGQVGIGFLDVSADAWAIQLSKESQRGKLTGSMTIGLYLGMFIGSAILTPLADSINFPTAYVLGGLLILPIIGCILFVNETIITSKKQYTLKPLIKQLTQKKLMLFLIFLTIISLNSGIISLTVPIYMEMSLGLSVTIIGVVSSIFSISRAAGSFIFGALSDIYGRNNTLIVIMSGTILFSVLLLTAVNQEILTFIYAILGFLIGGLFAVLFALCMDNTKKGYLALQFGIFMAFINLGELSGGSISGSLISLFSYQQVFLYAAWVVGPAFLLFYLLKHMTHTKTGSWK